MSVGQVGSGEPAAVLGVGGAVCTNTWVRRLGVRTGTRKHEALSICPKLVVAQRDAHRGALRFEPVLQAADAHMAYVMAVELGKVIFPARGAVRAVRPMKALAEALIGQIVGVVGCRAHVGCDEGTLVVLLAAQSGVLLDVEGSVQFLKRIRTEGTLVGVVPPHRTEAWSYLELLATLGARTIRNLTDLGAVTMVSRFKEMELLLWQLAWGRDVYLPAEVTTSPGIVRTQVFESPLQSVEEAVLSAHGLVEELVQATGVRTAVSGGLHIDVAFDNGEEFPRSWSVGGGDARDVVDRVRWQLGGWAGGGPLARSEPRLDAASAGVAPKPLWGGRSAGNE